MHKTVTSSCQRIIRPNTVWLKYLQYVINWNYRFRLKMMLLIKTTSSARTTMMSTRIWRTRFSARRRRNIKGQGRVRASPTRRDLIWRSAASSHSGSVFSRQLGYRPNTKTCIANSGRRQWSDVDELDFWQISNALSMDYVDCSAVLIPSFVNSLYGGTAPRVILSSRYNQHEFHNWHCVWILRCFRFLNANNEVFTTEPVKNLGKGTPLCFYHVQNVSSESLSVYSVVKFRKYNK